MKSLLKTIGYIIVALALFISFQAQDAYAVCSIKANPTLTSAQGIIEHGSKVILTVEADDYNDCINTEGDSNNGKFTVQIFEDDGDDGDDEVEIELLDNVLEFRLSEKIELPFVTGTDECSLFTEGNYCEYVAKVTMGSQTLESNVIEYRCPDEGCTDGWDVHPDIFNMLSTCTVTNIQLDPEGDQTGKGTKGGPFLEIDPITGEFKSVTVIVQTQGCAPYELEKKYFDVYIEVAELGDEGEIEDWDELYGAVSNRESLLKGTYIGETNILRVTYRPGDEDCEEGKKCVYRAVVDTRIIEVSGFELGLLAPTPMNHFSWLALVFDGLDGVTDRSLGKQTSEFYGSTVRYDCFEDDDCSEIDWEITHHNGVNSVGDPIIQDVTQFFDIDSPCYTTTKELGADGTRQDTPSYLEDCYEFLAPIPGFKTTNNAGDDNLKFTDDDKRVGILNVRELKLEDYINSIFQIALGVLMVLSVVMIVVAGVQYMTVESFYGKSDAKQRISGALMGLILSLGIFVILNTINPRLLEINFGQGVDIVAVDIDSVQGGDGYAKPGGTIEQIPPELMSTILVPGKIYCPGSGGQSVIPAIAQSFIDLSTYRYGAKGSPLQTGETYQDSPDKLCESGVQCRTFCPVDSFCVDCSGFINHVLKCAGTINSSLGNTASIFQGVNPYTYYNETSQEIDNVALEIGDLVGEPGHVGIYIGSGQIVESTSFQQGRLENNNTQQNQFSSRRPTFIRYIRKFNSL